MSSLLDTYNKTLICKINTLTVLYGNFKPQVHVMICTYVCIYCMYHDKNGSYIMISEISILRSTYGNINLLKGNSKILEIS